VAKVALVRGSRFQAPNGGSLGPKELLEHSALPPVLSAAILQTGTGRLGKRLALAARAPFDRTRLSLRRLAALQTVRSKS